LLRIAALILLLQRGQLGALQELLLLLLLVVLNEHGCGVWRLLRRSWLLQWYWWRLQRVLRR